MLLNRTEFDDLLRYGMIPELVGRLPVFCALDDLDEDALLQILTEPKNALVKQYLKSFEMDDVELEFQPEALQTVVELAIKKGTGARALRSILESLMLDLMYEIPDEDTTEKLVITSEIVLEGVSARLGSLDSSGEEEADEGGGEDASSGDIAPEPQTAAQPEPAANPEEPSRQKKSA
jgi:ATP-dependent Clp protease ATP-binding subunit ClpX